MFAIIAVSLYAIEYSEFLKRHNIVYEFGERLAGNSKLIRNLFHALRLGFRIDYHTASHLIFGMLLTYLFSFEAMMIINILWEIADGWIKPTKQFETTNNKIIDFFLREFCVSEGKIDIIDFFVMTTGGLFVLFLRWVLSPEALNTLF